MIGIFLPSRSQFVFQIIVSTLSVLCLLNSSVFAQSKTSAQNYSIQGTIVDVVGGTSYPGIVHVKNGKIQRVFKQGQPILKSTPKPKLTDVTIYPGLIDGHNHLKYNFLPLWVPSKPTFNNRNEWPDLGDYSKGVKEVYRAVYENSPACAALPDKSEEKIACLIATRCEALAYGEMKALTGGVTTLQGSTSYASDTSDVSFRGLSQNEGKGADLENKLTACINDGVRNIERDAINGVANTIRSTAVGLESTPWNQPKFQEQVVAEMDSGATRAFYLHIGEGIDESSYNEYSLAEDMGLIRKELVVIHGTAFTEKLFSAMGKAGMSLVWSPLSNLLLYQQTTDVVTAQKSGVNVTLGSDWSMSGSKNLIGELKVAAAALTAKLERPLAHEEYVWLVQMVTINAARAGQVDKQLGSIERGKLADLFVIRTSVQDPMQALVEAQESQVEAVIVGGSPLYGERSALTAITGKTYEASSFVSEQCGGDKAFVTERTRDPKVLAEKLAPQMKAAFDKLTGSVKLPSGKMSPIKEVLGTAFQTPDPLCATHDQRYKDSVGRVLESLEN